MTSSPDHLMASLRLPFTRPLHPCFVHPWRGLPPCCRTSPYIATPQALIAGMPSRCGLSPLLPIPCPPVMHKAPRILPLQPFPLGDSRRSLLKDSESVVASVLDLAPVCTVLTHSSSCETEGEKGEKLSVKEGGSKVHSSVFVLAREWGKRLFTTSAPVRRVQASVGLCTLVLYTSVYTVR